MLHVGLSDTERVQKIRVTWSDGKNQVLEDIPADQRLTLDYKDARLTDTPSQHNNSEIFNDVTVEHGIVHTHRENDHDDFAIESLLPHKMSQFGPALAVGDINNDGLDDFFVGGAKGFEAALYVQNPDGGTFNASNLRLWEKENGYEDVAAQFFDADADGDLDLYVVSGGNEWPADHEMYRDRLYLNSDGNFTKGTNNLPNINASGSCIKPFDFDRDGDLDLFVGSRLFPQKYPYAQPSQLLENGGGEFRDVTEEKASGLQEAGMVTDALWTDFDGDGQTDLIVVGEWTDIQFFKNSNGNLSRDTTILPDSQGWWNSIEGEDLDNDGDMDYVIGNLGLNYKYKATQEEPFEVYATDFDDNGTNDIVLGYYNQGNLFPLRGRECTSNQMPFIKEKFPSYDSFGAADLVQVYGSEKLKQALHLKATMFSSVYLENLGPGKFKIHVLPNEAQISSINAIRIDDFDKDGLKDILVAGNLYQSEVETPRNDASIGLLLKGNGTSQFTPLALEDSGVFLDGDVKRMRSIRLGKSNAKKAILVVRNSDIVTLISTTK